MDDDFVRVKTEDFVKIITERDRLRKQVTEVQQLCTEQLLKIRELEAK
jgi:translation initiation factor 1 (eIF-1/SUI1)